MRLRGAAGLVIVAALAGCSGVTSPISDFDPLSPDFYARYGPDARAEAGEADGPAPLPEDRVRPTLGSTQGADLFDIRRPPPEPSALEQGVAFLRVGEPDQAHKAFMRSLRTEPHPAAALTGAGIAAEAQDLLTLARRYFEMARDLAPNSEVAHNNLGVVLYRLGDYARARRAFYAAYALSSGRNDLARRNLALSEAAVRATYPRTDSRESHEVQRIGRSEYRLFQKDDGAAAG